MQGIKQNLDHSIDMVHSLTMVAAMNSLVQYSSFFRMKLFKALQWGIAYQNRGLLNDEFLQKS